MPLLIALRFVCACASSDNHYVYAHTSNQSSDGGISFERSESSSDDSDYQDYVDMIGGGADDDDEAQAAAGEK